MGSNDVLYRRAQTYAHIAGAVLLFYDTLLTLPAEIKFMWKGKIRVGFVLYAMARYSFFISLALTIPYFILQERDSSANLQNALYLAYQSFSVVAVIGIHCILAGRAWAASHRNKWVAVSVGGLLVLYTGVSVIRMVLGSTTSAFNMTLAAMQAWNVIMSDTLVILVTAYYAWKDGSRLKDLYSSKLRTLHNIFIRQGVFRFILIFIWVLEISFTDKFLNPLIGGVDTPLEDAISTILVCRFMLELREYDSQSLSVPSFWLGDCEEHPKTEVVSFRTSNVADSTTSTLHAHLSRITDVLMEEFGNEPTRQTSTLLSPLEDDSEFSGWKSERVEDIESGQFGQRNV